MEIAFKKQNNQGESCKIKITCTGVGWQTRNAACNRILLVEPDEIKLHNVTVSDVKGKHHGVICPYCGCFTIVPKDKNLFQKFKLKVISHE